MSAKTEKTMEQARHTPIPFNHVTNFATTEGPETALPVLVGGLAIRSLLDVGCGTGGWLRAAIKYGIDDIYGIDGVEIPAAQLRFPREKFLRVDFRRAWSVGRTFDAALCLEVAEHLEEAHAETLIKSLVEHAPLVFFSAACPDQLGEHHVNCQWPVYWQNVFNRFGYVCDDALRWELWNDDRIEPWYRQNLIVARRDPQGAGREPRIRTVVHPTMIGLLQRELRRVEAGEYGFAWYAAMLIRAFKVKVAEKFRRKAR